MDGDGVICPVCSVLNAPGANFCSACGASLPEVDEVATGSYPVVGVDVAGAGEVGQLIVTRGGTSYLALGMTRQSAIEDRSIEVVDLRTLAPILFT